jgi:hypothetical protein
VRLKELIEKLEKIERKHGDLPVFDERDYQLAAIEYNDDEEGAAVLRFESEF